MRNLIISIMLSLFLFFPMTAVGDTDTLNDADTSSTTDFYVSKNVTLTYNVATGQDGFCAIASHKLGNTLFGGGSDTTKVFRDNSGTKVKGTDYTTPPSSANATNAFGAPIGTDPWEAI